ncbi:MAG: hypothetical protein ABII01_01765 [Candidatus Woesearchaeota archaeon]
MKKLNNMKDLYVFGNEHLEFDSFATKVAERFDNVNIIKCHSPDMLLNIDQEKLTILDVVKNIKNPLIIEDVSQIRASHIMSLHDFDLGFFLNLLKEVGMEKKVRIIGVPPEGDPAKIAEKVQKWI